MDIVIVGGGQLGQEICYDLNLEGHELTLIDIDSDVVNRLVEELDIKGVVGSGTDIQVLSEADVSRCQTFIAVTASDEVNIISGYMASTLGAPYRIIRGRNLEYTKNIDFIQDHFKADFVINQDLEAAIDIVQVIDYPSASYVESLHNNEVQLIRLRVIPHSHIDGMSVSQVRKLVENCVICSIENKSNDKVIIPSGQTVIQADTYLNVIALKDDYDRLAQLAGHHHQERFISVIISGGSRICEYLLPELHKRKINSKVIESNFKRAEQLSVEFPDDEIIHGDGTDPKFLVAQRLASYDVAISLMNVDEENLIFSLFSHSLKVKKNISKVNRTSLLKLVHADFLDSIISPRVSISDAIIKRVRSLVNRQHNQLLGYARLSTSTHSEVLEFLVTKNDKIINQRIMDLNIDPRVFIGLIIRNNQKIIPKGSDMILENDYLIIIDIEKRVRSVDEILAHE